MGKVNTSCTDRIPVLLPRGSEEEPWIDFEILWIRDEDWCTPFGFVNIFPFINNVFILFGVICMVNYII